MSSEKAPRRRPVFFKKPGPLLKLLDQEEGSLFAGESADGMVIPFDAAASQTPAPEEFFTREEREKLIDFARDVLNQESQIIAGHGANLDDSFCRAAAMILACSGNVIVSGMGKAGLIGQKIAATLSSTGTPSHFLHPAEAIHGDLGRIRKNDLILILSNSGETDEILRILPSLKHFGIPIISMTKADSTLALASGAVLALAIPGEADPLNLAPSNSTAVMLALGDALAFAVSQKRSFCEEDFAQFHPGGSLGLKLSLVDEFMRPLSECRLATADRTIREIFVESHIPGRRTGAILLVDADSSLAGIFTDSDLAKLFEKRNDSFLDLPVRDFMTRTPKSVQIGTKMAEAVELMGSKKISELPVLDADGKPVGILDITDLVRFTS